MSAKKKYSSKPRRTVVEIDGEDYEIVQMSGAQTEEWRETLAARYDANDSESRATLVRHKGMYADLISRCVFPVNVPPGQSRSPVAASVVNSWSNECCEAVYEDCQTVNGFNQEGQDEAKKDSTTQNSTAGS